MWILSDSFQIQRGCRLDDPLSPYIFLLCAEILSLMLKYDENVKCIKVGYTDYKVSQFTDDTTILFEVSKQAFKETMNILSIFAAVSGLILIKLKLEQYGSVAKSSAEKRSIIDTK